MATAISDVKAFAALLKGGYICETCDNYTDKRTYGVFEKDETVPAGNRKIGHITKRQFINFMSEGIIDYTVTGLSKNKTHHFFELSMLVNQEATENEECEEKHETLG